ncbi:MAG: nuclear pore complex subunit [Bacteroidetes bacterium RIFCSPLOWO2_12_FULL_35_15]|nr:MAG: nuclear pore complex subunit [Bacteroidetes bacterium RIFCSPLOWO2_12_FULL_35_15]
MDQLNFEGTEDTPTVMIDRAKELFQLSGRSLPEDVTAFYKPVIEWLDLFSESPTKNLTLEVKLEYFNTASSKIILDILMKLEEIHQEGSSVIQVNWLYDKRDDDMLEAGEEYKDLVEVPFELLGY